MVIYLTGDEPLQKFACNTSNRNGLIDMD